MTRFTLLAFAYIVAHPLLAGCGGDDDSCDVVAQTGCDDGLVCEYVTGGDPACFDPVVIRGQVFDLADDAAVEGAHVVAIDANGAAVTSVAISDAEGDYDLVLPSTRDSNGNPGPVEFTLRADAAGYQTFPSGLRQSLPIDSGAAVPDGDILVVQSALTDIGLLALPAGSGTSEIYGETDVPGDDVGILVVAESGSAAFVAIANRDGDYRIFNVPAGSYSVTAYARGVNYESIDVTLDSDAEAEVNLELIGDDAGTVEGTVQIVNAPGGSVTSVILVVESTFDDVWGRGQTVPGLRAPEPGVAPNIEGAYVIEGVPAGRYVVLAAFENDFLVRDPDISIGGTSTLHIGVSPGATTTVEGFKVTEALAVFGPGANQPEQVTGDPLLRWEDDSSEDNYDIEVFDAFGELVWETSILGESGNDPELRYAGPGLLPAMYYQFRVTSSKDGVPLSRTEDLKGVFFTP